MKAKKRKSGIVEWAMHYHQIVILVVSFLVAFGAIGLKKMNKNEFPSFTIRQGIVIAVYPGATASEIEEQVTKPLENYIFTYKEVKKAKTHSITKDGMAIVQIELNDNISNKDEFWSKFKHGISLFRPQLPSGVLAVQTIDDFGDTSALLVTMESNDKTYRELKQYMDALQDELRGIANVGRMNVYGMQKEQIAVYVDTKKLSKYSINETFLAMNLFGKGFTTTGGRIKTNEYTSPIYVSKSLNTVRDIQNLIVYSDPLGNTVRLKDVARVVKEYSAPTSYITNNGNKCLLLSVEMKQGKDIVQMGDDVKEKMEKFQKTLPPEVEMFTITDQSEVVKISVISFLEELLIAMATVILVVILLMPLRVALVAASTIPISIFISLGIFWAFDIELNTVTLAALIVTLGMIVDNSIVIIDSYLEKISEGLSRWHASIQSTSEFFKAILSASLAISITFFPFLFTTKGMIRDFLSSFPWSILIVLLVSLLVATLLVPYLQFWFIKKPLKNTNGSGKKKKFSFLDKIQDAYNWLVDKCFNLPRTTLALGVLSVILGVFLLTIPPMQFLPTAERNQFAVEIYMPTGTSVEKTAKVADSLEQILKKDSRIVSIASFKGTSSPRFSNSYAPVLGGTEFAQFIVNTIDKNTTVELLDELSPKYSNAFPEARIRFKQLGYSQAIYPIEVRISSSNIADIKTTADTLMSFLHKMSALKHIHTSFGEPLATTNIVLDEDKASRLGISSMMLKTSMAMRFGSGFPVGTIWEGDYDIPVVLKSMTANNSRVKDVKNELLPATGGLTSVPLRQVATVVPRWEDGQICRRNGIRTLTVIADIKRGENAMKHTETVKKVIANMDLPQGVSISYGGEQEQVDEQLPQIMSALFIAIAIIFFILLGHFRNVKIALLLLFSLKLCLFGAGAGILIQGIDLSMTCILGLISLMGILVRNGIIMIDYAEELRVYEKMSVRDAIYYSAKRRMRPIFLTSAAASMGVVPMIISKSPLWMPMGSVICYGTLITMIFILTVIPIGYWLVMEGKFSQKQIFKK